MRMDLKQMSELLGYTLEHENQEIKNLVYDSRQVTKGSVFFAIKGQDSDGHQYIEDAVRNGAIAVVFPLVPITPTKFIFLDGSP